MKEGVFSYLGRFTPEEYLPFLDAIITRLKGYGPRQFAEFVDRFITEREDFERVNDMVSDLKFEKGWILSMSVPTQYTRKHDEIVERLQQLRYVKAVDNFLKHTRKITLADLDDVVGLHALYCSGFGISLNVRLREGGRSLLDAAVEAGNQELIMEWLGLQTCLAPMRLEVKDPHEKIISFIWYQTENDPILSVLPYRYTDNDHTFQYFLVPNKRS